MRVRGLPLVLVWMALLAACSGGAPKAPDLPPLTPTMATRLAWSVQMGPTLPGQRPLAVAGGVLLTNAAGVLRELDATTGAVRWQADLGVKLNTGVGSDGTTAAVVSQGNELIAVRSGARAWSQRLPAPSYTPPLVAGERVFVLSADRSVLAFDAASGERLWTSNRPADPLVLRHPGVLLAVGDTLVVGAGGRLQGVDPNNGRQRWTVALAVPRGTNEVERMVDLVAPVSRQGTQVCARAYSAAVGCVDARDGTLLWSRASTGLAGLAGNESLLVGSDSNGRVRAWARQDGRELWSVDRLALRSLSAPLAVGRVVVLADDKGLVHVLSREDGSDMARLSTDASGSVSEPVLAGNTLVVQTRSGGVFAWLPE